MVRTLAASTLPSRPPPPFFPVPPSAHNILSPLPLLSPRLRPVFLLRLHTTHTAMKDSSDHATGVFLCIISTCFFGASIYVLLDDAQVGSSTLSATCSKASSSLTFAGGYALSTLLPLTSIPLLIFLMVRYVALRLYLIN